VLVNGLYWKSRLAQWPPLSKVIQEWLGLHDLVGIEGRVVDEHTGHLHRPHEVATAHQSILAERAGMHRSIIDWWADPDRQHRPSLLPFAGRGHGTLSLTGWDGKRLRRRTGRLDGEPEGDATVPYWSAMPYEWSGNTAKSAVNPCEERHGALTSAAGIQAALKSLNEVNPPPDRGDGDPSATMLGLAVDDIAGPGVELGGSVLVGSEPAAELGATVEAQAISSSGEALPVEISLDDSGRFTLPVPETGVSEIVVTARWYRDEDDRGFEVSEQIAVIPEAWPAGQELGEERGV
jgi:hypothetical protein